MTRILVFLFVSFLIYSSGYSQNFFKGRLTDKSTSKFIGGANIIILGTTSGTTSNPDGTFELEAKKKKITVVISHLSYAIIQTEISSKIELNTFTLEKGIYQLDRVNIRLGEYDGPTELIKFDSTEFQVKEKERIKSYSEGELVIVEDHAEFFGGMDNLKAFVALNFRYPSQVLSENLEGRAYANFTISEYGQTKDIEVKIVGEDSNDVVLTEIIRVVDSMPTWHPAYQRGKPVPVRMVIPIYYAANGYGK